MPDFVPKKREHGLKVEEFQGEVLVYDLDNHRAHCLNGVAVSVWNELDGTRSVEDIARRIAATQRAQPDEDLVWRALNELDGASLLETSLEAAVIADRSKRQTLAKIGWAIGIPLVLSIAVPEPAFAQSILTIT